MKKYLKFSGVVAALFALIAFILMMATPAIMYKDDVVASGIVALFGQKGETPLLGLPTETKLAWSALVAWIFVITALVILISGIVLPILKVKALNKFMGLSNCLAALLLVVGGVFTFITIVVFFTANGADNVPDNCYLGAGWIIAGVLEILAGLLTALPLVAEFGKKK